jgi:hypothetical protein
MGDGYIGDKLLDFNVGRYANQEQEFLPRGLQPDDVNEERATDVRIPTLLMNKSLR